MPQWGNNLPPTKLKSPNTVIPDDPPLLQQLGDMEGEVKEIEMELAAIKRDRLHLFKTRKHPEATADSALEEDPFAKFTEVVRLREELVKAKNTADEERMQREKFEIRLKELESKLNCVWSSGNNTVSYTGTRLTMPSDTDAANLKSQLRDLKEELEEIRLTLNEKNEELQEYRGKYLQAQQHVEELKRQLDVVDYDNKQVSEQIQLEIHKMKMQFKEKLQELAPLPDLLKGAQIQLQEAQQLQRLAEDNAQQVQTELHRVQEKLILTVNSYNQVKVEKIQLQEENKNLRQTIEENRKEIEELVTNLNDSKCSLLRHQEKLSQLEQRYKEKTTECSELLQNLEDMREESTRCLNRTKERSDTMRRYLHTQITELERQLVQSRAQCRSSQKERDEIRQRMQIQINNLQENFELVEIRLRALQGQVNSLKTSYAVILSDENETCELNKITS